MLLSFQHFYHDPFPTKFRSLWCFNSQDLRRAGFTTTVRCLSWPQVLGALARIYNPIWPGIHTPTQIGAPYVMSGYPVGTQLATLAWGPNHMIHEFLSLHERNLAHVPAAAPVAVEDLTRFDVFLISIGTSRLSEAFRSNMAIAVFEMQVLAPAHVELLHPIFGGSAPDTFIVDRNPGPGNSIQLKPLEFKHFHPGQPGETTIARIDNKPYYSENLVKGGVAILPSLINYDGTHIPAAFTPEQFAPGYVQWERQPNNLSPNMCLLSTQTLINMEVIALHPEGGQSWYRHAAGAPGILSWRAPRNLFNEQFRLTEAQQFDPDLVFAYGSGFRKHVAMDRTWMNPGNYNSAGGVASLSDWVYARHAQTLALLPAWRVNNIPLWKTVVDRTTNWPAIGKLQLPMTVWAAHAFSIDMFRVWDI